MFSSLVQTHGATVLQRVGAAGFCGASTATSTGPDERGKRVGLYRKASDEKLNKYSRWKVFRTPPFLQFLLKCTV